ncbi:MAG: polysaccharide deacetylase family protein [Polyangiales bacterium]|nr:polysaccharide deacetylase family protein [Myxococcales bacterium]MCB9660913.1 polysaccharide deacetylase family protein [Sandaracinaceae bacterium]
MSKRSVVRRIGQALACATAVGSGAGLAHLTHADAQHGRGLQTHVAPLLSSTRAPSPARPTIGQSPSAEDTDALPMGVLPPRPDPFGDHLRDGMVMTGATPHRLLLLTFDDGPEIRTTPTVLDTLDEYGIKAVFFVNATRFDSDHPRERAQRELLQEILRRGHFLGNHTYHHPPLTDLDNDQIRDELHKNEEFIFAITGGRPVLVRPPYGAFSPRVARTIAQLGYTPMLWNLSTGDTMVRTGDEVASTFLRVLRRQEREKGEYGGIVLMHDTHGWSVDGLPRILAGLRQRNCELAASGEELYDFVSDPSVFFRYRGDASPEEFTPSIEPDPAWLERRQAALREETGRRCQAVASRD